MILAACKLSRPILYIFQIIINYLWVTSRWYLHPVWHHAELCVFRQHLIACALSCFNEHLLFYSLFVKEILFCCRWITSNFLTCKWPRTANTTTLPEFSTWMQILDWTPLGQERQIKIQREHERRGQQESQTPQVRAYCFVQRTKSHQEATVTTDMYRQRLFKGSNKISQVQCDWSLIKLREDLVQ